MRTVGEWLDHTGAQITVVFNVFSYKDYDIYNDLLSRNKHF